jgi:hypothetical protein
MSSSTYKHLQVVHSDMKSKNVLLNSAMHAKISDVSAQQCCDLWIPLCLGP